MTSREVIPASAFYRNRKIGSAVYEVEVMPTASLPSTSAVTSGPTDIILGDTYTVTMQSRDKDGIDGNWSVDTYTVVFEDDHTTHTYTATHESGGQYSTTFTPTESFRVNIDLTNAYTDMDAELDTNIIEEDYWVDVHPVPADPAASSITSTFPDQDPSTSIPDHFSDTAITVTVQLVDINGDPKTDSEVWLKVE